MPSDRILRSQVNQTSEKSGSDIVAESPPPSSKSSLAMAGLNLDELAAAILPSLNQSVQEAVVNNVSDQFTKVYECIENNLGKINRQLTLIGERHESIQSELTTISESICSLKTNQSLINEKVSHLEENVNRSVQKVARVETCVENLILAKDRTEESIRSITEANEKLPIELEAMKCRDIAEKVQETVDSILKEKRASDPGPISPSAATNVDSETCLLTECKLENIEQYNRRDCLLFFGLVECEGENCTDKIVETAHAMGVPITHSDVSISHRLFTRNRRPGEPRAVIAKFTRRDTKNAIYQLKHRLKHSDNHYNVYVREQLTKERARALFWLKEEGYEVTTYECRLLYKKGSSNGVINSLDELITRIGWDSGKLKKAFNK